MRGDIEGLCRRHGLPLTIQRRLILETLAARHDHPTADGIFDQIRRHNPEISRTTVYRSLDALVRVGAARRVSHPGAAARYEMEGPQHHHLVCLECGAMTDVEAESLNALPLPRETGGFRIEDYSIQFRGVCAACARKTR